MARRRCDRLAVRRSGALRSADVRVRPGWPGVHVAHGERDAARDVRHLRLVGPTRRTDGARDDATHGD